MNTSQPRLPEIYMRLNDLKKLQKLMAIQEVSGRALSEAAGYRSHTHMRRILNGQLSTLTPERAARIARFLGVGMDDLFVARLSTDTGKTVKRGNAA